MEFKHFDKDAVVFLEELARNNNKEWFEANRSRYEKNLLEPSKKFVTAMGERLAEIAPNVKAIPKIDRSIFRLFKDVRFHKGAPFKTHQGILFWEGDGRLESSCFYFHIEPPFYNAGVGMATFTQEIINEYRKSLINPKYGKAFAIIVRNAEKNGYVLGGKKRKTTPKGFKADEVTEEFLKYESIYLSDETPINADFYSDDFLDNLMKIYTDMLPFHRWLSNVVARAAGGSKKEK